MHPTIDRTSRNALYEAALLDLSGCGDLYVAIEQGDIATALKLRRRFEADMRLLDDLGWHKAIEPDTQTFSLTQPTPELRIIVERLYWDGQSTLSHSHELDDDAVRETRDLCRAAPEILARVAEEPYTQPSTGTP